MTEAGPIRAHSSGFQTDWFGLAVWSFTAFAVSFGRFTLDLIPILFLLGPLVSVQLGLEVEGRETAGRLDLIRSFAASLTVFALLFDPGPRAAAFAFPWLAYCAWVALQGVARLAKLRLFSASEACFLIARLYLPVGGVWLVLSRWGATPLGFGEPILLLTAVHFHFAGFAAAVMAGATARAWVKSKRSLSIGEKITLAVVVLGPALLAAGFVISPLLRMVFALLLAAGLLVFAGMLAALLSHIKPPSARLLLGVAIAAVIFGMAFVGVYAIGEYTERYWLLIPQMARWHGVANAFGFSFCGLLAWKLTAQEFRS